MKIKQETLQDHDVPAEMRVNVRHCCDNTVELRDAAKTIATGTLRDLGVNSLYMFTGQAERNALSNKTPAELHLKMYSRDTGVSIRGRISIIRSDDKGLALRFTLPE